LFYDGLAEGSKGSIYWYCHTGTVQIGSPPCLLVFADNNDDTTTAVAIHSELVAADAGDHIVVFPRREFLD
jgi:hypothetical protein